VGMGFYSQCTAVLVSAHQQQALLVPKKKKNYPFFPHLFKLLFFPSQWTTYLNFRFASLQHFFPYKPYKYMQNIVQRA